MGTGSRLTGHSVVKAGLATHFYDEEMVHAIQEEMDQYPFKSKEQAWRMLEWGDNVIQEPFSLLPYLKTIEKCFSQPTVDKIMKALANEATAWSLAQLEKMKKKSPLSLAVTLEALQDVDRHNMSIDQVSQQDYRLTNRFLKSNDFLTGVETLIVENFFAPFEDPDDELILKGKNIKENMQEDLVDLEGLYHQAVNSTDPVRNKYSTYKSLMDMSDPSISYYDENIPAPDVSEITVQKDYESFDSDSDLEVSRALREEHYDGSPVFIENSGRDATQILADIERINPELIWANEHPIDPTGRWHSPGFMENLKTMQDALDISTFATPNRDVVTQKYELDEEEIATLVEEEDSSLEAQAEPEDNIRDFGFSDDEMTISDNDMLSANLSDSDKDVMWANNSFDPSLDSELERFGLTSYSE